MKIYLVRHGETTLNALGIHQPATAELSDVGKKQAEELARRIQHLPIDKIITSTHKRALETADIINMRMNTPMEQSDLFVEMRRPTEIVNESAKDPEVVSIKKLIKENYGDPLWRYSDEENYYDLLDRALKALQHLETQEVENILVVSHGTFIKMLVGVMMYGSDLAPSMGSELIDFLYTHNSGITIAEYRNHSWSLLTWNDFAHLGE